jgi:hypothetical protein
LSIMPCQRAVPMLVLQPVPIVAAARRHSNL